MNEKGLIYEIKSDLNRLGLQDNPFSESAEFTSSQNIDEIFTGRRAELKKVISTLIGQKRKRILIYGWWGIGKTAFMYQILKILKQKELKKDTLSTYISLPPEIDIATASLISLAFEMKDDEWAQRYLNLMGIYQGGNLYKRKKKFDAGIPGLKGSIEEEPLNTNLAQIPSLSFDYLLKRALNYYKRIIIFIDDLDKQDPDKVKKLLRDSQGLLKGNASFVLSGHPSGLSKDIVTGNMGIFDLTQELTLMDFDTMNQMLIKYLNSARKKNKFHRFFRILKNYKKHSELDLTDPKSVRPFTVDAAKRICKYSDGHPRWLNRLANYVLLTAQDMKVDTIDIEIIEKGRQYARKELQSQPELTSDLLYLFHLVEEKGLLTDENVSIEELRKIGVNTFNELLPLLEKLIQNDLLRHRPSETHLQYIVSPIVKNEKIDL